MESKERPEESENIEKVLNLIRRILQTYPDVILFTQLTNFSESTAEIRLKVGRPESH